MHCTNCGKEIDPKAVVCPGCGCSLKKKKPIYKKWWFWTLIALVIIIGAAGSSGGESVDTPTPTPSTGEEVEKVEKNPVPAEFSGDFPVVVSASISDNMIGVPELKINIENKTQKEIAAVKFHFLGKDVYGKEVNTIFSQDKLYTDTPIQAGGYCSRAWQLLDTNVKTGEVYVYSVYFSDGTEWGNRDASDSVIRKYGVKIEALG